MEDEHEDLEGEVQAAGGAVGVAEVKDGRDIKQVDRIEVEFRDNNEGELADRYNWKYNWRYEAYEQVVIGVYSENSKLKKKIAEMTKIIH